MSDRTSRSRCAALSANAMATARTGVRNLLLYVLDVARVVMSNVTAALPKEGGRIAPSAPPKGKKAQKDSSALSPQRAAETGTLAKQDRKARPELRFLAWSHLGPFQFGWGKLIISFSLEASRLRHIVFQTRS
ncbi:hypothetical protein PoB_001596500 [Plakobranchus ocellatus]|uniref:Uncharacterized protein n=1 Tax=Plakobranchus ocellatus TaxID=259542 RepID=A0AAV3Z2S4_9GAST|nr:hypothetical protein PoB_001596500 [Plakobranchus ocellatus]